MDVVSEDFVVGDVDVGEDRLVEFAAGGLAGVDVQLVGVLEQVQMRVEERPPAGEVTVYLAELLGDALPVTGDLPEPLADALLRERAVGGEIEEVVFFDGELRELVFEVLAEQLLRGDLVVERGSQRPGRAVRLPPATARPARAARHPSSVRGRRYRWTRHYEHT